MKDIFQADRYGVYGEIPLSEVFVDIPPLDSGEVELHSFFLLLENHPPRAKGLLQGKDMSPDLPGYLLDETLHVAQNRKIKILPQRSAQKKIPHGSSDEIDLFLSPLCQPADCFQDLGFFQQLYFHYPSYPQTPVRGEFTTGRNISSSQPCFPAQSSQSQPWLSYMQSAQMVVAGFWH